MTPRNRPDAYVANARASLGDLTARERDVLALMAEGHTNAAAAALLFITERAVEKHVTWIFLKLDLKHLSDINRRVVAVLAYLGAQEAVDAG